MECRAHRVAVVDDDYLTRRGLIADLEATSEISVCLYGTQSDALKWDPEHWADIDVLLVDIHDDTQIDLPGADIYTGIRVAEAAGRHGVRTVALTPCEDVYLTMRLCEAEIDEIYLRRDITRPGQLARIAKEPNPTSAPKAPSVDELRRLGAGPRPRPNKLLRYYEESPFNGRLSAATIKALRHAFGISTRQVINLRNAAQRSDFHEEHVGENRFRYPKPRWPHTRALLLRLTGRNREIHEPVQSLDTIGKTGLR